ncbi:MAG: hypothetical protein V4642_02120 [Bacteroidota bacterium]
MKKFLIISLLIIVAWIGYNFVQNQLIVVRNDGIFISRTKEDSKKNGFFRGNYMPLKDSIQLIENRVKSDTVWSEKIWWIEHNFLFYPTVHEAERGRTIVIPLFSGNYIYGNYRFELLTFKSLHINYYQNPKIQAFSFILFPDTLQFSVESKKYNESWNNRKITDTITYVLEPFKDEK